MVLFMLSIGFLNQMIEIGVMVLFCQNDDNNHDMIDNPIQFLLFKKKTKTKKNFVQDFILNN